ncbi:MAG: hypothetical protein M1150_00980 [Patescibacteria group bacterium]|nr:hypothetical protein [Patescibacteria group bacterium]
MYCKNVSNEFGKVKEVKAQTAPVDYNDVIFLHHSTGQGLIDGGNVRKLLTDLGYQFWDHGYNSQGLTLPNGTSAGYNYNIPNDNTDPIGLVTTFELPFDASSPAHPSQPTNALSGLLRHKVIAFKSCFPASAIYNDAMLNQYKDYYLRIRNVTDKYRDHIFIAFSTPPLHPSSTDSQQATRARAFANWLKSPEYLDGHPNLFAFDFFDLLAAPADATTEANMLRAEYRPPYVDSHPNALANQTIGPIFVNFIDNAAKSYNPNSWPIKSLLGDLNGDNVVNKVDVDELLNNWGYFPRNVKADTDINGVVNGVDFALVIKDWGR